MELFKTISSITKVKQRLACLYLGWGYHRSLSVSPGFKFKKFCIETLGNGKQHGKHTSVDSQIFFKLKKVNSCFTDLIYFFFNFSKKKSGLANIFLCFPFSKVSAKNIYYCGQNPGESDIAHI